MQTIKLEGSICKWLGARFQPFSFTTLNEKDLEGETDRIFIAPYTIEIDVPDDLDRLIYDKTLTHLQTKRKLILAENESRIQQIDQQIQEHLAIEA